MHYDFIGVIEQMECMSVCVGERERERERERVDACLGCLSPAGCPAAGGPF